MRLAIQLAYLGRGLTRTNPLVGCVIVSKDEELLGWGFHEYFGGPHAEAMAFSHLKSDSYSRQQLSRATVYCTLEPCLSWPGKKTPACANLFLSEQGRPLVQRLVVAHRDPRPEIQGKSLSYLAKAGLDITEGVGKQEAAWMNRAYIKWITQKVPYVVLKFAQSLDGKLHPLPYRREQLSGPKSMKLVQHLRAQSQALLVGGNTWRTDAPGLNVRLPYYTNSPHFEQPRKIILSRTLQNIAGAACHSLDSTDDFQNLLSQLAMQNVARLQVEAGPYWQQQLIEQSLWDEMLIIQTPKFLGAGRGLELRGESLQGKFSSFDHYTWKILGRDIVWQGVQLRDNPCLRELLNTQDP